MPKKKPTKPQNDSRIQIPPGAAIYGVVSATDFNGTPAIEVHGIGGPHTSLRAKKGAIEVILPSYTIIGIHPGKHFVAWDGASYRAMPTLESIQETDHLTLIGSVDVPPFGLLADKIAASRVGLASASPYLIMAAAARREPDTLTITEPPLHPATRDAIKQALFRIDKVHWPHITGMRVKTHYPLDEPVPPQLPEVLMGQIRWYASMLYGTEADQYDSLRSDAHYGKWLANLADRIRARVMTNLDRLENGDPTATIIAYHGLIRHKIEQELRTILSEICGQYEHGIAPSQRTRAVPEPSGLGAKPTETTSSISRTELRDSYLAAHPGVKKLDICYAAGQHYTEWKRWLRGVDVLKDGTAPDRAFRTLLESGKTPSEYKNRPRPKGWK